MTEKKFPFIPFSSHELIDIMPCFPIECDAWLISSVFCFLFFVFCWVFFSNSEYLDDFFFNDEKMVEGTLFCFSYADLLGRWSENYICLFVSLVRYFQG